MNLERDYGRGAPGAREQDSRRPRSRPASRGPWATAVATARSHEDESSGWASRRPPPVEPTRKAAAPSATMERRGRERGRTSAPPAAMEGGRIKTQLRLRLTLGGGDAAAESEQIRELLTGDLSSGGVFVACADPPEVGLRAHVAVCRPGGGVAFTALGEVVWRRPAGDRAGRPAGFGLRFERLDLRDGAVISGLLNLLQRQQVATAPAPPALVPDLALYGLDDMTADVVAILQTQLPTELRGFIDGFSRVADRDAFLWRWAYQGIHVTTLSCVDPRQVDAAREGKLLGMMYLILVDDALDRALHAGAPDREREAVFEALCLLPLRPVSEGQAPAHLGAAAQHPCVAFGRRLWAALLQRARALPRAHEFLPLWHMDLLQLLQDARYQRLTRAQPQLTSESECLAHAGGFTGLPLLLSGSLDLCASPAFDAREAGLLREVLTLAQRMHHLSFVLAGWQRACSLGDLGGAAVAHGVMRGVVSPAELAAEHADVHGPDIARRLQEARVDSHFLTEWLRARHQTRELAARLRSVDAQRLLQAHQRLLWMQLHHRGLL